MTKVNLEELHERIGKGYDDEKVVLLHPDECFHLYNYIWELKNNGSKSRDQWVILIMTIMIFGLTFYFLGQS